MMNSGAPTPVFGLLGKKLGHSYSPQLHRELGGYDYGLFEKPPEELEDFLLSGDFQGINVTIPYKQTVLPHCHQLSSAAAAIGSVNTIVRQEDGTLFGDNTDAAGFLYLLEGSGVSIQGKKVLVLGSGGSSRTVGYVLEQVGAGEIIIISRSGPVGYEDITSHLDCRILVNTTPVGMYPDNGASAVDLSRFPELELVADLIYNPERTRLLQQAALLKIPAVGGIGMLAAQAAAASELFTGIPWEPGRLQEVIRKIRLQNLNVVLVGMPGSGKTAIGKALGQLMDRPVVDTDQEIERLQGKSIPEIFSTEGEQAFRSYETQAIQEAGSRSGLIITTGGGCVTQSGNYWPLQQNGVILFLNRDLQLLAREGRPLSGGNLAAMFEKRLPLYEAFSDGQFHNDGTVAEAAEKALELFWQLV